MEFRYIELTISEKRILIGISSIASWWNANHFWKYTVIAIFCKLSDISNGWDERWHDGLVGRRGIYGELVLCAATYRWNISGCRSNNDERKTTRNYGLGNYRSDIFNHRVYRNGTFDTWCDNWNYWRHNCINQKILKVSEYFFSRTRCLFCQTYR